MWYIFNDYLCKYLLFSRKNDIILDGEYDYLKELCWRILKEIFHHLHKYLSCVNNLRILEKVGFNYQNLPAMK